MMAGTENENGAAVAPNNGNLLLDEGDLGRDELYELSLMVGIDPENAPSHSGALGDESPDDVAADHDGEGDDASKNKFGTSLWRFSQLMPINGA
jgi:hypothetical protein